MQSFDWWTTLHTDPPTPPSAVVTNFPKKTDVVEIAHAGIVDDIYGASFVDSAVCGDPMDANGHGTFVAGVVGAVGNNNLGVTGMNQAISLIACQFMDATGNGWVSDAIQCIDYCISKEAHVMSNSWGGVAYSAALQVRSQSLRTAWKSCKHKRDESVLLAFIVKKHEGEVFWAAQNPDKYVNSRHSKQTPLL